ncbi:YbbR-like domain-containing protein [Candidatus Oscillochloris fontis]|uniref:CdaR family protein n=1 Tax=Candidatus Oscillochloris fontis TaxID=2496868 RepID=UPI001930F92E|nr:CdaR family protein [Candidatus Oscillochloris fontis]
MTSLRSTVLRALLAFGLSFALWAFVSFSQNPEELVPFEGLTPQVVGLHSNLVIVDANGMPNVTLPTINVTLRTDRNQRTELRPVDIRTVVDLSGFDAGEHIVPINVQATRSTISFTLPNDGVSPSAIPIRLERLISHTVPIDLKVVGNLPFSFERGEAQISAAGQAIDRVTVSGPQNRVERVVGVQTTANVEQLRASYQAPLGLTAVDANGQVVDGVQMNPSTVNVRIPITSVVGLKLVPVQASIAGLPDAGYTITGVKIDPPLIALTGSSGPLDAVAVLLTEEIDIQGAYTPLVRQADIIFPAGTSPQVGEPTSVQVTILIAPISQSFQVVLPAEVQLINIGNGLLASATPVVVSLDLTGSSALLNQLAQQTLVARVDLGGLGPGSYELPVLINLPSGVQLVGVPPSVTVVVRIPTVSPTETPLPNPNIPENTPTSASGEETSEPGPTATPSNEPTETETSIVVPDTGHRQSHLRWGFGGGFAAPEDLFWCFLAASPPKNTKNWGLGLQPQGLCTCPGVSA